MVITIIGLGLIGGSMALALKKRGYADRIIGVETNPEHADFALKHKLVDQINDLESGLQDSDLIIVAVPADILLTVMPKILDSIKESTMVTDVGSTKYPVIKKVENHPKRKNYVAAHPMAGTEHSGPMAAKEDLFDNNAVIIVNDQESDPKACAEIERMYQILNMRIIKMDAKEHDEHAAYVSHISHISSFVLALTVLEKEKNAAHIFNLASGGFDSTVRLAKSASSMWTPIFQENASNILSVMDVYIKYLLLFKEYINTKQGAKINDLIQQANKIEKILD